MNHLHFPSSAVSETIGFYEKYFGFQKRRILGKTHVLVGEKGFLLAVDEETQGAPLPERVHIGFQLSDPDAVIELYDRMNGDKVTFASALKRPSPRAIHYYCVDPSGNRIEVGWYDF